MSEQPTQSKGTHCSGGCPVTAIFRAFRMAIHPSKLGLALAAVVLIAVWGSLLDGIWRNKQKPLDGELKAYWRVSNIGDWRKAVRQQQFERMQSTYAQLAQLGNPMPENLEKRFDRDPASEVKKLLDEIERKYTNLVTDASDEKAAETARQFNGMYSGVADLGPKGIFRSFLRYESDLVRHAMNATVSLNFMGGLHGVLNARGEHAEPFALAAVDASKLGVIPSLILMARGKQWFITEHFWFFVFFSLGSLVIWALFGGAVARLAAMNFARDERISPKAALDFARRKFLGFFTAPLLPAALVAMVGVLLFIGGLVVALPYIGEIIGGLTMGLALVGGFVIALVVIGALAAGGLFYPTIAAEGSDSFDAISRSYSYVFSKPWRAILYGLTALIYGALTYAFVRVFVLIMLKGTRFFVGIGTWAADNRPGTGHAHASKLDAMWANPMFDEMWRKPAAMGQIHWESFAACLIGLWLLLVVLLLCSYLISFYVSASTIIYFLLRRDVDATDIEDVYIDGDEESSLPTAGGTEPPPAIEAPPAG